jgi:hypothetical protein
LLGERAVVLILEAEAVLVGIVQRMEHLVLTHLPNLKLPLQQHLIQLLLVEEVQVLLLEGTTHKEQVEAIHLLLFQALLLQQVVVAVERLKQIETEYLAVLVEAVLGYIHQLLELVEQAHRYKEEMVEVAISMRLVILVRVAVVAVHLRSVLMQRLTQAEMGVLV